MIIPILIYNKYETSMQTLSYMMLVPFLIIISIMDFRTIYVYDIVILSGIIMQSVILLLSKELRMGLMGNIKGLCIGAILSYFLAKITKSLGDGDIFLSFIVGSIYGIFILLTRKKSIKSEIPFTPFISLATILIILTQDNIINLYFDILSKNL